MTHPPRRVDLFFTPDILPITHPSGVERYSIYIFATDDAARRGGLQEFRLAVNDQVYEACRPKGCVIGSKSKSKNGTTRCGGVGHR
jgi:hypothetical protein